MCMFTTYILHSDQRGQYYIGSTSLPMNDRLRRHLSNHRGFTGSVADWKIVYQQHFQTKSEAAKLERKIKRRGARRFLDDIENQSK